MKAENTDSGIARNTARTAASVLAALFCITCTTYLQLVSCPLCIKSIYFKQQECKGLTSLPKYKQNFSRYFRF